MNFTLIENNEDLNFLNKELLQRSSVGIDSEFRRTTKYNMKLALLQVNDSEEIYLIDCLKIKDPGNSCSFLNSNKVKKIFHACREDMEAIYAWTEIKLTNLFDTQLANAFLGGGYSISYKRLVNDHMGLELDKNEARTNWLRRPLTESQLNYAASDVLFLIDLFQEQEKKLILSKKLGWLEEELSFISSQALLQPLSEVTDKRRFGMTKEEEKDLLHNFNKIVCDIAVNKNINPTLFLSKKSQKDFLRLALNLGLEKTFQKITYWRKDLLYQPISALLVNSIDVN